MKPCPYPIAAPLPHEAPMILLDHVIGMNPQSLEAAARVTADRPFFEERRGMPAHVRHSAGARGGMKPCPYPIEALLPHEAPMILLDHVIGMDPQSLEAAVRVTAGRPFFEEGRGMPAHVALEWMAQACGAWAGAQALDTGAKIKLGLLLGTRSFRAECAWLEEGRMFTVQASQNYMDNEIGVFDCSVTDTVSGAEVAVAQLTVYQSDQIDHLLVAHQQSGQS